MPEPKTKTEARTGPWRSTRPCHRWKKPRRREVNLLPSIFLRWLIYLPSRTPSLSFKFVQSRQGMQERPKIRPDKVAQACSLSYSGGRDQKDGGLMPAWTKSLETPSQLMARPSCHHSYPGKYKWEDQGPGRPGHKAKPYLQNNQCNKRASGVAQVV
jgi:hypothetical protein